MELVFSKADQIFDLVARHSTLWVYAFVLIAMIVENFFPPFPGDMAVFVCGVYAAGGNVSWTLIYVISVIGTLISVMVLYYVGRRQGRAVFQRHGARWLGVKNLGRVERWFARWGDKALLLSRWLAGIRALLALFAGVGNVRASHMFFYTLISALTWNFALLFLALRLRQDWRKIEAILTAYGWLILIVMVIVAGIFVIRMIRHRRGGNVA